MRNDFDRLLAELRNSQALVSQAVVSPPSESDWRSCVPPASAVVELRFSNGTRLKAEYWRIKRPGGKQINIRNDNDPVSSFDHKPGIDAIKELQVQVGEKKLLDVQMDRETGDLIFEFADQVEFRVFNFGDESEAWEFIFSDGSREYASYVFE